MALWHFCATLTLTKKQCLNYVLTKPQAGANSRQTAPSAAEQSYHETTRKTSPLVTGNDLFIIANFSYFLWQKRFSALPTYKAIMTEDKKSKKNVKFLEILSILVYKSVCIIRLKLLLKILVIFNIKYETQANSR